MFDKTQLPRSRLNMCLYPKTAFLIMSWCPGLATHVHNIVFLKIQNYTYFSEIYLLIGCNILYKVS